MPFRDRMRRAFQSRPSTSESPPNQSSPKASVPSSGSGADLQHLETVKSDDNKPTDADKTSELKHVDTKTSFISLRKITSRKPKAKKEDPWKDWPENVYKPHEMPAMRYKRPADPKHTKHLEAYSFEKAFIGKRRSRGSLYSPMGSRLPSRIGSVASRRSTATKEGPSRSASVAETAVIEDDAEGGGIENVGISRQNTDSHDQSSPLSTSRTAVPDLVSSSSLDTSSDDNADISPSPLATSKTVTQGDVSRAELTNGFPFSQKEPSPGKPFSEEELARALSKTAIAVEGDR